MPKYYQIHRGIEPSKVEKKFIKNKPFFFSKKNSFWYNIEKDISKDYGGYIIYEIYIPNYLFTSSFNPIKKNKIVKITKKNIFEYNQLKNVYGGHNDFIEEMKKRNIIGIDATFNKGKIYKTENPPEGYLWQKPKDIKIKKIETVILNSKKL
jgi:hypothetical protein